MLEYFPAPSSQPDTRKKETDPKLIRPQQAITESYLQGTENRKLGSAARDGIRKDGAQHGWKSRGPKRRRRRSHGRPSSPPLRPPASVRYFLPPFTCRAEGKYLLCGPDKKLGWAGPSCDVGRILGKWAAKATGKQLHTEFPVVLLQQYFFSLKKSNTFSFLRFSAILFEQYFFFSNTL